MKRGLLNLNDIKEKINAIKGKDIEISINRGRRKIEIYKGVVEHIYPSVFTVKVLDNSNTKAVACSYSDVLCGDVKIESGESSAINQNE
ncbi:MAG: Veg family protein [Christensenellales bacterium]